MLFRSFWTTPEIQDWIPIYFGLIGLQAFNSYARFGDFSLVILGAAFYVAPAIALWSGFVVGCNPRLLGRLITTYLILCSVFAVSAFLAFKGLRGTLVEEVGKGILITFQGFSAGGICGLWRTSEIAGWHLASGSCFAIILGVCSQQREKQILYFTLAAIFAYLTIPTGRRKALVLVLVFTAIYLILFSRRATAASRSAVISSILGSGAMAYAAYAMFLISAKGDAFDLYLNRTLTAKDDIFERFQNQGVNAFSRALDVSQGLGLGVGAGANLGNLRLSEEASAARQGIQSLAYVSEGGGGRIVAELGIPGLIVGGMLAWMLFLTLRRNFRLMKWLPPEVGFLMLGLLSFGLANIVFFFSAEIGRAHV